MSRPDRTEAKAEFFKLLAQGVSVSAAARQVGVHNTVGYYWVKKSVTAARAVASAAQQKVLRYASVRSVVTPARGP